MKSMAEISGKSPEADRQHVRQGNLTNAYNLIDQDVWIDALSKIDCQSVGALSYPLHITGLAD
jgi:hypothetical protein